MAAPIIQPILRRPAFAAELDILAAMVAEGILEGINAASMRPHGQLWERVAERKPSGAFPRPSRFGLIERGPRAADRPALTHGILRPRDIEAERQAVADFAKVAFA